MTRSTSVRAESEEDKQCACAVLGEIQNYFERKMTGCQLPTSLWCGISQVTDTAASGKESESAIEAGEDWSNVTNAAVRHEYLSTKPRSSSPL